MRISNKVKAKQAEINDKDKPMGIRVNKFINKNVQFYNP